MLSKKNNLVEKLKENLFSVFIDETTDINTTSCGTIAKESKRMQNRLLILEKIYALDRAGATGKRLFQNHNATSG